VDGRGVVEGERMPTGCPDRRPQRVVRFLRTFRRPWAYLYAQAETQFRSTPARNAIRSRGLSLG